MLEQSTLLKLFFRSSWIRFFFLIALSTHLSSLSWAEKTLQNLSLEEKVSQLIMVPVYNDGAHDNLEEVIALLNHYPIGGIIFMQGTVDKQRNAYEKLQGKSKVPLLTAQDNEWGTSMRLSDGQRFPRNLTLGALRDESLIYQMGKEVALQCQLVGVHLNFAPVIDINSNPENPVINDRSFGENAEDVTRKGLLFMKGLQEGKILSCAKHFPGHGDTSIDSHFSLPVIHKSFEDLQNLEWQPFYRLSQAGVDSIMTAHLHLPLISGVPTTLCRKSIYRLLKEEIKFKGLILTDALHMKAIADRYALGKSEVEALKAGHDILLAPRDPKAAIEAIINAVTHHEILESEIDDHVLKILNAKERLNLQKSSTLKPYVISKEAQALKEKLFKEAITLTTDLKALPIDFKKKTALVQVGRDVLMKDSLELIYAPYEEQYPNSIPPFFEKLIDCAHADYFFIPKASSDAFIKNKIIELSKYDQVIVGVYEMNKFSKKNFGLTNSTLSFFDQIDNSKVAVCLFGSPYSLKYFKDQKVILMGYENDREAQIGCAEILLGKRDATGKLPISITY